MGPAGQPLRRPPRPGRGEQAGAAGRAVGRDPERVAAVDPHRRGEGLPGGQADDLAALPGHPHHPGPCGPVDVGGVHGQAARHVELVRQHPGRPETREAGAVRRGRRAAVTGRGPEHGRAAPAAARRQGCQDQDAGQCSARVHAGYLTTKCGTERRAGHSHDSPCQGAAGLRPMYHETSATLCGWSLVSINSSEPKVRASSPGSSKNSALNDGLLCSRLRLKVL